MEKGLEKKSKLDSPKVEVNYTCYEINDKTGKRRGILVCESISNEPPRYIFLNCSDLEIKPFLPNISTAKMYDLFRTAEVDKDKARGLLKLLR